MAGFRIGRGRNTRNPQQHGQHPPQGPPPGGPQGQARRPAQGPPPGPYGTGHGQPAPPQQPYGGGPQGQQGWTAGGGFGGGEPEYFGDPRADGGAGRGGQAGRHDPYANNPGHTQAFSLSDPYGNGGGGYSDGNTYGGGDGPSGPRLTWQELLSGIVLRPQRTFLQTRDHAVWGTALTITFLYGMLAVFGLDETRETVINATLRSALQYVLGTAVAMVVTGLILGAVTHTLARQFGGDGRWAPTVGLSMLIMSLTDAPRLLVAMFLGGNAPVVQVLGWITWVLAGALFTSMISRSHDLPWPKALGASAIQLLALLFLIKLGTL